VKWRGAKAAPIGKTDSRCPGISTVPPVLASALARSAAGASAGSDTPDEAGADEEAGGTATSDEVVDAAPGAVASELWTKLARHPFIGEVRHTRAWQRS
jgi:hypothetical protein